MKLILTLLVRDEVDIIQSNLDYHLSQGVDFIIATDNGSVDGSTRVLKEYEKRGLLKYLHQPPSDFSQGRWVTCMARLAFTQYGADWVINSDCDEFFVPVGACNDESLKQVLARISQNVGTLRISRHDFVPFEWPGKDCLPENMVFRKRFSSNLKGQILPPKVIHRGVHDVTISQGNHSAKSKFFKNASASFDEIKVFHFPIRSLHQFQTKVRNAGSGYSENKCLSKETGFHKRYWYDLLLEGKLEKEFLGHFYDRQELQEALSTGEIIEDRTLSDYLETLFCTTRKP